MKWKKTGLTLVEILIVLGIIALFVGLLLPALNVVKETAKEAKQKAQFNAIDIALMNFKYDYGKYPNSDWALAYCGAQKLSEALMGWDLLGFHPKSDFNANGQNDEGVFIYDSNSIDLRKGPYLEGENANAFRLGNVPEQNKYGLFVDTVLLAPDTYVLCDVFNMTKVRLAGGKIVSAGAPILYYCANTSGKTIREIYNVNDNNPIIGLKEIKDNKEHPLRSGPYPYPYPAHPNPYNNLDEFFYGVEDPVNPKIGYIQDPKITARSWPYRPDSYLLISAGADGLYGTGDDICNFGN